jgi:hypothetical protein
MSGSRSRPIATRAGGSDELQEGVRRDGGEEGGPSERVTKSTRWVTRADLLACACAAG